MDFLQAISITGWGRESCTASSQFSFLACAFPLLCVGLLETLSAKERDEIFVSISLQI